MRQRPDSGRIVCVVAVAFWLQALAADSSSRLGGASGISAFPGAYFRLVVPPSGSVLARFSKDGLRVALTAEALETASVFPWRWPAQEVPIRVPKLVVDELPELSGLLPQKQALGLELRPVQFFRDKPPESALTLTLKRWASDSVCWSYQSSPWLKPTDRIDGCPTVDVPVGSQVDMALKVSGQPEQNLGIGVVCSLSPVTLSDVRRGEAAVEAQITIRDSQGTAVQTIHKPISGLGFG